MKTIKIRRWYEVPKNFTGIVEWGNRDKWWLKNGKSHRTDGPAVINADGEIFYYINNIRTYKEAVEVYAALFPETV